MNELLFAARRGHLGVVKTLLSSGADVKATNEGGATALMVAAQEGHDDIVKALLGAKSSVASRDKDGRTALALAAHAGHLEVVKTLLDAGADAAASDRSGAGPLRAAAEQGHVDVVAVLLPALKATANGKAEMSAALLLACGQGRVDVVKALLAAGADAGSQDKSGLTALAVACQHGRVDAVAALLAARADVNGKTKDGRTPLLVAALGGHLAAVKALLSAKADVQARDARGWCALTCAASKGSVEVVKVLLAGGAEAGAKSTDGETPLMAAARAGHAETLEALLGAGAEAGAADKEKVTALMVAAHAGHAPAVQVLLGAGASVDAKERVGWTALMLAAQKGRNDVVMALLDGKASVGAKDDDGLTPLMLAALKGHDHVVKSLLAAGADPLARDKKGRTPLAFAMQNNHVEAAKVLREAAAKPKAAPAPAAEAPPPAPAKKPTPPPAVEAPPPVPAKKATPPPASAPAVESDPALRFRRKPTDPPPAPEPAAPAAPSAPGEQPLERARRLSGVGDARGAFAALTREAILRAAAVPDQARLVAGICIKAGVVEDFVKDFARSDASRELLAAFGRAFMEGGQTQTAQFFYRAIPPQKLTAKDEQDLTELQLRAGDEERAGVLLRRVLQSKPLADDPAWPYSLARLAEESGQTRFALQVYALFEEKGVLYRDAASRLAKLRGPAPAPAPAPEPAKAAPAPAAGDEVGMLIAGRYKVVSKIGEGGMGIVYEGYDNNLMRRVAIKRMSDTLRTDARARERFMREATIIARLTHPYILAIHDVVAQPEGIYLVFEYVDGHSLAKTLYERTRLTLPEARRVMAFVCAAVDHAHQHNILHRDLTPENVMVDKQGFVKVMDFGLARETEASVKRLTHQEVMGTPAYMAPEHHLGEAGAPSDVFSLGVMLYEMLTGELPFNGPDFLAQKERRRYKTPCSLVAGLPAGLDALVDAVLDPQPARRPGAKEFLTRLQGLS
ncbi:MAG: ankyrin repeat domain-containing protein [Elusimicrobia bacterium]|nr:ankyrin repeat domain-containing protein [Elusimicrobiota bacterium]